MSDVQEYDGWTIPTHGNDLIDSVSIYYDAGTRTKVRWGLCVEDPPNWIEDLGRKTEGIVTMGDDDRFVIDPSYRGLLVMWFLFSDGDVCIVDWVDCKPKNIKWEQI